MKDWETPTVETFNCTNNELNCNQFNKKDFNDNDNCHWDIPCNCES